MFHHFIKMVDRLVSEVYVKGMHISSVHEDFKLFSVRSVCEMNAYFIRDGRSFTVRRVFEGNACFITSLRW